MTAVKSTPQELRFRMSLIFAFIGIVLAARFGKGGNLVNKPWKLALWGTVSAIAGAAIGKKIGERMFIQAAAQEVAEKIETAQPE